LQDVAYLRILKADIARMKTILNERKITLNWGINVWRDKNKFQKGIAR
jgi:hypothetical protein